ncbi:MAG: hypothetical protein ACRD2G_06610, partial [Terriglobia bacterium]
VAAVKNARQEGGCAGTLEMRRKVHRRAKRVRSKETVNAPGEKGVPILSFPPGRTDRDGLKDRGQP